MNGWSCGRTDEVVEGQMDERIDKRMNRGMDGWKKGEMDG